MSKYTTEVRFIVESMNAYDESQDRDKIDEMVNAVSSRIIGEYPIFDESYRQTLNNKIIRHFYTREIGFETVGLWRFKLNVKMNEIMPYFNKLYESELIHFDPLLDFHYTKEGSNNGETQRDKNGTEAENVSTTRDGNTVRDGNESKIQTQTGTADSQTSRSEVSESTGENSGNRNNINMSSNTLSNEGQGSNRGSSENVGHSENLQGYSDTPQGALNNLEQGNYLTNGSKADDQTDSISMSEGESKSNNEEINTTVSSGSDENKSENVTNNSSTGIGSQNDVNETNDTMMDSVRSNEDRQEEENRSKLNNANENENITNFNAYLEHISGKKSLTSYSKLLMEFRDTFLNIDMMIIQSLEDLFMGVW